MIQNTWVLDNNTEDGVPVRNPARFFFFFFFGQKKKNPNTILPQRGALGQSNLIIRIQKLFCHQRELIA